MGPLIFPTSDVNLTNGAWIRGLPKSFFLFESVHITTTRLASHQADAVQDHVRSKTEY